MWRNVEQGDRAAQVRPPRSRFPVKAQGPQSRPPVRQVWESGDKLAFPDEASFTTSSLIKGFLVFLPKPFN